MPQPAHTQKKKPYIAIIGGGPAGLIAAEHLSKQKFDVHVYEQKPSLARKLLMAGRGGLNLTHSEELSTFIARYGARQQQLTPIIEAFKPEDLIRWCEGLGEETFVGSSGRIFPKSFKASPLLRAWQNRLNAQGVTFHMRHKWTGWQENGALTFERTAPSPSKDSETVSVSCDAVLLALGGASWPKLGSDAKWLPLLQQKGVEIQNFKPSNCGFFADLSPIFFDKCAGHPLKPVRVTHMDHSVYSEMMIDKNGLEGSAIYALSAPIRDAIEASGNTMITLDLAPDLTHDKLIQRLSTPRGRTSLSTFLKKKLKLGRVATSLVQEQVHKNKNANNIGAEELAALIKSIPITLTEPFSIERAISSAGGISFENLDSHYMLKNVQGVFACGEMLDWEAPTGGYLLQGCFATGLHAAKGIEKWLKDT